MQQQFAHAHYALHVERTMYGVYQQLKSMVWGEGSEREKTEPQSAPSPAPKPQKRFFSGEITSLSDTSGMIDHQVSSTGLL